MGNIRAEHIKSCNSKKFPNGTRVIAQKSGVSCNGIHGAVLYSYYTINYWNGYKFKNQTWRVLCDDGKKRSFQSIIYEDHNKCPQKN